MKRGKILIINNNSKHLKELKKALKNYEIKTVSFKKAKGIRNINAIILSGGNISIKEIGRAHV